MEKAARILIVEDEALIAQDLSHRVGTMGYEVVGVIDSGEKAVELAESLRPDLVLMDVRLRGAMNGVEAARLIKLTVGSAITYVTANPIPITMPHYVLKPFSTRDLARGITSALAAVSP